MVFFGNNNNLKSMKVLTIKWIYPKGIKNSEVEKLHTYLKIVRNTMSRKRILIIKN